MSQRSPYNDRYKVEQKGKTRKSASAAKPKRDIADLTPASESKLAKRKKSIWRRASSQSKPAPAPTFVMPPEMQRLRRIWWVLWTLSLAIAVGILFLQQTPSLRAFAPVGWAAWAAAMGATFYLEFFPLRKMRLAAIEAAKQGGKGGKGGKSKGGDKSAPSAMSDATDSGDDTGDGE
jgi:hypothetical protein